MVLMLILCLTMLIPSSNCRSQDKESDTNHPVTKGCYYKGKYHHGNWEDGCEHLCTCLNSQTGHYKCRRRCPRYKALPRNCFMVLPPGGKCCKTPHCINFNRKDTQRSYSHNTERPYNSDHIGFKNSTLQKGNPWKEVKANSQKRNPILFENPIHIPQSISNHDNISNFIRYTTPDNDDSIQQYADTVTHTFFVTPKTKQKVNDRSHYLDISDSHAFLSQLPPTINLNESKIEIVTKQNSTKLKNEIFSSENSVETNGNHNSNDSDNFQFDNKDVVSEKAINTQKLSELPSNTSNSSYNRNKPVTTPSAYDQEKSNNGESQSIKDNDSDQLDSDNVKVKENNLLNLVRINTQISSELKRRMTAIDKFPSPRNESNRNVPFETTKRVDGVTKKKDLEESLNAIKKYRKSSTENVYPSLNVKVPIIDNPNIRVGNETKKVSNGEVTSQARRKSVTFKPIIPIFANTSLKYKDKEWGKFVKELTYMFMEVNRLKRNKLKSKEILISTLMTTKQPNAKIFYDKPRKHFYGKGRIKPATDLKLKILDNEYITKKKTARPFRVRDCFHVDKLYKPGEKWRDHCNQTCTCIFDGRYKCHKERCLSQSGLPPGCRLKIHRLGCCPKLECTRENINTHPTRFNRLTNQIPDGTLYRHRHNVKFIRTSTGVIRLEHPQRGPGRWVGSFVSNTKSHQKGFCLYKNQKYMTGDVWLDGCNTCRCINGMIGRYTCSIRCPTFSNIPSNCSLHFVSKRQCCPIMRCNNRVVTTTLKNVIISPILQSYFDIQSRTTASPFKVDNNSGYRTNEKPTQHVNHGHSESDRTKMEQFYSSSSKVVSRNTPRGNI